MTNVTTLKNRKLSNRINDNMTNVDVQIIFILTNGKSIKTVHLCAVFKIFD